MVSQGTVRVKESRAWGAATVPAITFTWSMTARTDKPRGQDRSSTSPPSSWSETMAFLSTAQLLTTTVLSIACPRMAAWHQRCPTESCPSMALREKHADPHSFWSLQYTSEGRERKGVHPTKEKWHKGRWVLFYDPFYFQIRDTQATEIIYTCPRLSSPSRHTSYCK